LLLCAASENIRKPSMGMAGHSELLLSRVCLAAGRLTMCRHRWGKESIIKEQGATSLLDCCKRVDVRRWLSSIQDMDLQESASGESRLQKLSK
jgi:hypothetical protein